MQNWNHFRNVIDNSMSDNQSMDCAVNIDSEINELTNTIIQARDASIPTKSMNARFQIDEYTIEAIAYRNYTRRLFQRALPANRPYLKVTINLLNRKLEKESTQLYYTTRHC